ncbi:MAG: lycopene beta-cyclase CrtY [Sphingomonas sp.]
MPATIHCDVAIVGGGLAGGMIALALRKKRPDCDVRLIEGGARIGGNHLWSFFASDVAAADRWLAAPLVSYGWTRYDVAFPAHRRTIRAPYYSVESERFDRIVREAMPAEALMMRRKALAASSKAVVLADGDRVEAGGVIDCRGPGELGLLDLGWQKFHGREFALADAHDLEHPLVMDATVAQIDGYRFVYALPFAATRAVRRGHLLQRRARARHRDVGGADRRLCRGARLAGRSRRARGGGGAAGGDGRRFSTPIGNRAATRSPRRGCAPGCSTR